MVRTSKTDKQSAVPAPVPTPVEQPIVAEKAPKQRVKKVKSVAAAAAPEPVVENVQVALEVCVDETSALAKLSEFEAKIQQASGFLSSMKADFKTLVKTVARELKNSHKASAKKKKTSGNRQPSGFTKPAPISDELAKFLGKAAGTEMARTDVSKELNAYICAKDLKDKTNGRFIHPDASLTKLLNLQSTDEQLSYFNLQKYIKHHFLKAAPVASV
jgi:chromatin remodeling complex protein RSC6